MKKRIKICWIAIAAFILICLVKVMTNETIFLRKDIIGSYICIDREKCFFSACRQEEGVLETIYIYGFRKPNESIRGSFIANADGSYWIFGEEIQEQRILLDESLSFKIIIDGEKYTFKKTSDVPVTLAEPSVLKEWIE